MIATGDTVTSKVKLAKALGVSPAMVDRYVVSGMPGENGRYDVAECRQWLAMYRATSGRPTKSMGSDEGGGELDLRERKLRAECDKLEEEARAKRLKTDLLEGELVRRSDVIAEFADFLSEAKPILESLPDDLAKEMPEEYRVIARNLAKQAVDRAFRKLASWQPEVSDDEEQEDEQR